MKAPQSREPMDVGPLVAAGKLTRADLVHGDYVASVLSGERRWVWDSSVGDFVYHRPTSEDSLSGAADVS